MHQHHTDLQHARALLHSAEAVLFDFNGTLSLDEDLLESCYDQALHHLGLPGLEHEEYSALLGLSDYEISHHLLAHRLEGRLTALHKSRLLDALCSLYLSAVSAHSRIPQEHRALVQDLTSAGIICAVVTGSLRQLVEPALQDAGIFHLLTGIITSEDVREGKPSPEGFLLARERFAPEAETIVVCEDSPAGVEAGRRAGMTVLSVHPGLNGADFTAPSLGTLQSCLREQ